MPARNTPTRYGSIAKALHWLTVAFIVVLIPLGILANGAPFGTDAELARKAWLFSMHKTTGIALLAIATTRILWSASQPKRAPLHPDRRAETFLAELVHTLLYVCLILVPLSGWISHAASTGYAPIWWPLGQSLPLVPKSDLLMKDAGALHVVFERVLLVSMILHVAGAVKHHVIDKDATLRRMLPGTPALPVLPPAHRSHLPHMTAPLVLALAIGIGAGLGLFKRAEPAAAPAITATAGNWTVTQGAITLNVVQMGQTVTGKFADWRATITYDEATRTGTAQVDIDTGSLTLGAVTAQALGPDFFNARTYPTATFDATLQDTGGQMTATGTLAIKDLSLPQTLPFTLDIRGDTATVQGQLVIDRRSYAMGIAYPDETTVGHNVTVEVTLTAQRN